MAGGTHAAPEGGRASRTATIGLVLVLLAVTGFLLTSSMMNAAAARRADEAGRLSDDYEQAATAVATEESLEREYRLEPGPSVRAGFDAASASLLAALSRIRVHGHAEDARTADEVAVDHAAYRTAAARLFAAVDRRDTERVLRIEGNDVDPRFLAMRARVSEAAARHRRQSLDELGRQHRFASTTRVITPLVLLAGFLLVAAFSSVLRRFRRQLDLASARAVHDSLYDGLTGLPNRTLLADRLGQALRADRRTGTSTGLLLLDLDRFRDINDTLGHRYGDQLLVQIGPRLVGALREVDTVARLGGDEFAVLLPSVRGVDGAMQVADKLRRALEAPFYVEGGIELDVEASVGVVVSGEHGDRADTLIQRADVAMYVAKQQNLGVLAYSSDVDGHSVERLSLLGELRRAIERDQLVLHFQPKVSLSTGSVVGAEALVRWRHPQRGLVPPDEFIPLAEHTGLIGPLTRHILGAALAQARRWSDAGRPLPIAVNLSARNLLDDQLADQVEGLLREHGVPAEMLELEVTESALMTQPARAQRLLARLRSLGVRLSVDDFGVGYTSLAQLKMLPVTEIKVDRSFVTTMGADQGNALIVRSVIDLGHSLGMATVAEGVETPEALAALVDFGCDVVQGYHLSRPLPADQFDAWYERWLGQPADALPVAT